MARPRVFVSSTYYDLKHVRASLDIFISSLGYDSVLSEKGDIAYAFDRPLDESCYAEVATCDIFVLIVGGRYGAAASDQQVDDSKGFHSRYESITKKEYEKAVELDLPIYIMVEKAVHSEHRTFQANRENNDVKYAHVDSTNIFILLDEILSKPRNNPIFAFERSTEIEDWLRDQWAGLFRELLKRAGQQKQLRALAEQVSDMRSLNETLQSYVEAIAQKVAPDRTRELQESERERQANRSARRTLSRHRVVEFLADRFSSSTDEVIGELLAASTVGGLKRRLLDVGPMYPGKRGDLETLVESDSFVMDVNALRDEGGRPELRRTSETRSQEK